jgi:hypothetical protein
MDLTSAVAKVTTPYKESISAKLSEDAFLKGIGLLRSEYGWKPDQDLIKRWWKQVCQLEDEWWSQAIDRYMLSDERFHPHPGQLITLANQAQLHERVKAKEAIASAEYAKKPKSKRPISYWRMRMRQEEAMAISIRTHLFKAFRFDRENPFEMKIVPKVLTAMMDEHGLAGEGREGQLEEAESLAAELMAERRPVTEAA